MSGATVAWDGALAAVVHDRGALIGYAYLLTGDRLAAQELVREAIVRTFARSRRRIGPDAAWTLVRERIVGAFLRAPRRRPEARAARRLGEAGEGIPSDASDGGSAPVTGAMWLLDRHQRACVVLRHVDGLDHDAIAAAVGLTGAEVDRRLAEASAVLAAELGGSGESP